MDEETNKIKQHIDTEREQLGRNLDEIEHRVKSATDLKAHFDKNTGWILGAAVAGGFLLSRAFRNSSTSARSMPVRRTESAPSSTHAAMSKHLSRVTDTVDDIFDGLAGVVADKLRSYVADVVPGFREHYAASDRQRGRPAFNQTEQDYFNRSTVK